MITKNGLQDVQQSSPFSGMAVDTSSEYGCDCDCDCDAGDIDNY